MLRRARQSPAKFAFLAWLRAFESGRVTANDANHQRRWMFPGEVSPKNALSTVVFKSELVQKKRTIQFLFIPILQSNAFTN
jgi:hypothetical protein